MKLVSCAGCDQPIRDKYLHKVLDQTWHINCVQCCDCGAKLTDKCFSRDGKLLCKNDFFKRYGTKCAGCSQTIYPQDFVRRARTKVFHLNCFTCMVCRKQLSTGEELYVLDENRFICKEDYLTRLSNRHSQGMSGNSILDPELEESMISPSESDHLIGDSDRDDEIFGNGPSIPEISQLSGLPHLNRPPSSGNGSAPTGLSCKSSPMSASSSNSDTGANASGDPLSVSSPGNNLTNNSNSNSGNNNDDNASGTKRRGPRTTIKAKQLETLKQAFAETPKPTRHIREQLATQTGLNMRVIQVWFQNRRSKERRMKDIGMNSARRHCFRTQRRVIRSIRPGQTDGIEESGDLSGHFGYFSESSNPGDYGYGGPPLQHGTGFYDFFPNQQGSHNGEGPPGLNQFPALGNGPRNLPSSASGLHDGPNVLRPSVLPFMGPGNNEVHNRATARGDLISSQQRSSPNVEGVLNLPPLTPDTYGRSSTESNATSFSNSLGHSTIPETPVW